MLIHLQAEKKPKLKEAINTKNYNRQKLLTLFPGGPVGPDSPVGPGDP